MRKEFPLKNLKSIDIDQENGLAVACYEEEKRFEVGKWYENSDYALTADAYILINSDYTKGESYRGIGFIEERFYEDVLLGCNLSENWQPANMEEVEKLLIKEAEKRGFKEGVKVNDFGLCPSSIGCGNIKKSINYPILQGNKLWFTTDDQYNLSVCVFDDGKWAEIIEEKKPLYTNSYGTEFFDGDDFWFVLSKPNCKPKIIHGIEGDTMTGVGYYSEALKEQECYRLIADNWDELKK